MQLGRYAKFVYHIRFINVCIRTERILEAHYYDQGRALIIRFDHTYISNRVADKSPNYTFGVTNEMFNYSYIFSFLFRKLRYFLAFWGTLVSLEIALVPSLYINKIHVVCHKNIYIFLLY